MPVAGELVGRFQGGHFTDLFDDGKPQAVVAGVLFAFVEAAEHSSGVKRNSQACITHRQFVRFQPDSDIAVGDIVVAGIAEQIV